MTIQVTTINGDKAGCIIYIGVSTPLKNTTPSFKNCNLPEKHLPLFPSNSHLKIEILSSSPGESSNH